VQQVYSTSAVFLSDTDAHDLCKYIDLQAWQAFSRQWHAPYTWLDEWLDAGYEGLLYALAHSTMPDRFHSYAKMRIWGNIRTLRLKRSHERRRNATFVQDLADWCEASAADTDERLAWLDVQVQAHTACFPPELLALYTAIRNGLSYSEYADSLGMRRPPMEKRYRRLVRLLREHLIEGTRTCADQARRNIAGQQDHHQARRAALAGVA